MFRAWMYVSAQLTAVAATSCQQIVDVAEWSPGSVTATSSSSSAAAGGGLGGGGAGGSGGIAGAATQPDLVGSWRFDEVSGTIAADATGHDHDGLLVAGAAFGPEGISGGRVDLLETQSVVMNSLANAGFPRSGTLSLWFFYTFPADELADRTLFDGYDETRNHIFLRRPGTALGAALFQLAFQTAQPGGAYAFSKSFTVARDGWTHVAVTWDEPSQVAAFYLDGALYETNDFEAAFVPDGQAFRLGNGLIGAIDEVRLYDRALLPEEAIMLASQR